MGLKKKHAWGSCIYNDLKFDGYVLLPYKKSGKKFCVLLSFPNLLISNQTLRGNILTLHLNLQ